MIHLNSFLTLFEDYLLSKSVHLKETNKGWGKANVQKNCSIKREGETRMAKNWILLSEALCASWTCLNFIAIANDSYLNWFVAFSSGFESSDSGCETIHIEIPLLKKTENQYTGFVIINPYPVWAVSSAPLLWFTVAVWLCEMFWLSVPPTVAQHCFSQRSSPVRQRS